MNQRDLEFHSLKFIRERTELFAGALESAAQICQEIGDEKGANEIMRRRALFLDDRAKHVRSLENVQ